MRRIEVTIPPGVDTGTRVCRFMIQDLVGNVVPSFRETSWTNNVIGSALSVTFWGNFLYQELSIMTGAVEAMVVDVQCIMQALSDLSTKFHTKFDGLTDRLFPADAATAAALARS